MVKQKGFTLVEGLLIVLIVSVVGFAGYYVWNKNNDTTSENTNTDNTIKAQTDKDPADKDENVTQADTSTKTTVSYGSVTYEIALPSGWAKKDVSVLTDSNLTYFISPDNSIQLEVQIVGPSDNLTDSETTQSSLGTILGYSDKYYTLYGYTGSATNNGYETISISACSDGKFCNTKLDNAYQLNFGLRSPDFVTGIFRNNENIDTISEILQSLVVTKN